MSETGSVLSGRLQHIRRELYGEHGGPLLAEDLGIPFRRWVAYETGVRGIPAEALLRFIALTGASPDWLLDGQGPCYRRQSAAGRDGFGGRLGDKWGDVS